MLLGTKKDGASLGKDASSVDPPDTAEILRDL
jgi:hypothetical protein